MRKITTIFLIICLITISIVACTPATEVPIAGFYTPGENIELINFEDCSKDYGSDVVKYFKLTIQITNSSDKPIYKDYNNFECIIDNEQHIGFYWDIPDAMTPFTLNPNNTTTIYLYIKIPIDVTVIKLGIHTQYDSAYYTLKTPNS